MAQMPLIIVKVFVLALAYDAAILLSWKTFLKSCARWSAVAMGKLCWTIKFVTITSVFKTSFLKTSSVSPLYKEDKWVCFLQEASACLWEGLLQCSFISFKPWWCQVKFFPQGRQWNLYLSCFTSLKLGERDKAVKTGSLPAKLGELTGLQTVISKLFFQTSAQVKWEGMPFWKGQEA